MSMTYYLHQPNSANTMFGIWIIHRLVINYVSFDNFGKSTFITHVITIHSSELASFLLVFTPNKLFVSIRWKGLENVQTITSEHVRTESGCIFPFVPFRSSHLDHRPLSQQREWGMLTACRHCCAAGIRCCQVSLSFISLLNIQRKVLDIE